MSVKSSKITKIPKPVYLTASGEYTRDWMSESNKTRYTANALVRALAEALGKEVDWDKSTLPPQLNS